ncbi:MAG: hypothetical protein LBK53_01275, partial [Heliobacteriaceae bacterium]|nr:hypothetical protein [Heliobacteriaceae bacterium]
FTNNYEYERLRTKTPEKPEPIRIPDNLVILTGQLWNLFQDPAHSKVRPTALFNTYYYPTPKSAANAFASLAPAAAEISTYLSQNDTQSFCSAESQGEGKPFN